MNIKPYLNILDKLYPNAQCSLIYHRDYELLIAVMLSAQTSDKAVNQVTKILFKKYPSLNKLKKAKLIDIEKIIHPLGMYKNKSKNILEIAKALNGSVPHSHQKLMKLNGVGNKTANVVLAELYHFPFLAVDTHVMRIAKRMKWVNINDSPLIIEKKLTKLIPSKDLIKVNHQLIEFGRHICKAKKPQCETCNFAKINKGKCYEEK